MSEHDVNSDYRQAGDVAFSFDKNAPDCLQIVDNPGGKVLVGLDIEQTQKLYAFLYMRHHKILELLEAARKAK